MSDFPIAPESEIGSLPGLIARSKKGKKYEDDDIDRDSEMQRKRDGKVRWLGVHPRSRQILLGIPVS